MGLDVYIYSAEKQKNSPEIARGEFVWGDLNVECYWRKNYFINSFFGDIYYEKVKDNPDFNCVFIRLTLKDVYKLKRAIQKCSSECWQRNSLEDTRYPTLRQLRRLIADMKANQDKKVYYGLGSW